MWVVIIAILIIFAICSSFFRIIWAILRPIFEYLYQSIVKGLRTTGMSEQAAKALVSLVSIMLIILIIIAGL